VPAHGRVRAFDRDLIHGGHYGQRPCSAAQRGRTHGCTDQAANVKKALANGEPSTHGTTRIIWCDYKPRLIEIVSAELEFKFECQCWQT
jgi:hypothetical protein